MGVFSYNIARQTHHLTGKQLIREVALAQLLYERGLS